MKFAGKVAHLDYVRWCNFCKTLSNLERSFFIFKKIKKTGNADNEFVIDSRNKKSRDITERLALTMRTKTRSAISGVANFEGEVAISVHRTVKTISLLIIKKSHSVLQHSCCMPLQWELKLSSSNGNIYQTASLVWFFSVWYRETEESCFYWLSRIFITFSTHKIGFFNAAWGLMMSTSAPHWCEEAIALV